MAGATLVTSVFGNLLAFPNRLAARAEVRGVTSRVGHGEKKADRCALFTTKGAHGADYRHHPLPHERQLAWLVGGGCPAAMDIREVHQEQRGPSGPAPAGWRRVRGRSDCSRP